MSGWPTPLPKLLRHVSTDFGIAHIHDAACLEMVVQTGFVWTRRAGIVCLAANRRYFALAKGNPAVAAIIAPPEVASAENAPGKAVIVSARASELYHYLHLQQNMHKHTESPRIHDSATIDSTALLSGDITIEQGVSIGPRVVIQGPATIRRNARIDAGALIGCEGLYTKEVLGVRRHITHYGGVEIQEDALIHAGAVVVRSAIFGEVTSIGKSAHIGILANIGHDAIIGDGATISSNVVVAGRAIIGAHAWVGASATVSNMVVVGSGATVRIGAVVIQDVPPGKEVSGNFALSHRRNMQRFLENVRDES